MHEFGYGRICLTANQKIPAHRMFWLTFRGALDPSLVLDHLCRNRKCVRPDHLEQVTNAENVRRGYSPSVVANRLLECFRGHSMTGANLYISPKMKKRLCRICMQIRQEKYRLLK